MPESPRGAVTLALLCGGASRRFGQDKGLCPVDGPGGVGETLVARAVRTLGEGWAEVLVVLRDAAQSEAYTPEFTGVRGASVARVVVDDDPEAPRAALVGLRTALRAATTPWIVALPVDLPAVERGDLAALAVAASSRRGPLVFAAEGSNGAAADFLPFPAAWPRATLAVVESALEAGTLRLRDVLTAAGATTLPCSAAAWERLRANANTPADLAAWSRANPAWP